MLGISFTRTVSSYTNYDEDIPTFCKCAISANIETSKGILRAVETVSVNNKIPATAS